MAPYLPCISPVSPQAVAALWRPSAAAELAISAAISQDEIEALEAEEVISR